MKTTLRSRQKSICSSQLASNEVINSRDPKNLSSDVTPKGLNRYCNTCDSPLFFFSVKRILFSQEWNGGRVLSKSRKQYQQTPFGSVLSENGPRKKYQQTIFPDHMSSVSKSFLEIYNRYATDRNTIYTRNSHRHSQLKLLHNHTVFRLRDVIKVRIDLYDGYGKHLLQGGDVLRVWMTDPSHNANVNGYVIDHKNGSYTGYVRGLWRGQCLIWVSIAFTKEYISLVIKYIEKHGLLYDVFGIFRKNKRYEKTKCSVKPQVYGLNHICNFTRENQGLSWYCGRPTDPRLTCSDWSEVQFTKNSDVGNVISRYQKHTLMKIQKVVTVIGDKEVVPSVMTPCYQRPAIETWLETQPVGFYYKAKWHTLGCNGQFNGTPESYRKCLYGHYMVLLGDSNLRTWYHVFRKNMDMEPAKPDIQQTPNCSFVPKRIDCFQSQRVDLNLSVFWAAHEIPFYGDDWYHKQYLRSVAWHIDRIPRVPNVVVVLHYWMHFIRTSPDTLREHVRDARFAIERLYKRVPGARVFIKGPHSATYRGLKNPIDFTRRANEQVMYEEFKELHDRIIYLNVWDMTTSTGNIDVHPSESTVKDMIDHFMSYLCRNN